MPQGFDFSFVPEGELVINEETHDIIKAIDNELKIQLSYNRIKSVTHNWFVDEIGANLEEIIGKPCNEEVSEYGKTKIIYALTYDGLWDSQEIHIRSEIINNICIVYTIYLKIYEPINENNNNLIVKSIEIEATLDLVKGVKIKYGWNPRR